MNETEALETLNARSSGAGLLLDFDGVLTPIVDDPEASQMPQNVAEALARIAARMRLVAVVSGRPLAFLVDRVAVPGIQLRGSYGVEVMRNGSPSVHPGMASWLEPLREATQTLHLATQDLPGVRVEEKSVSVAVHWRQASDRHLAERRISEVTSRIATASGLRLEPGKMVRELRAPLGIDKGVTVEDLAREFGLTLPVYIGDDLGDLPAFRKVQELGGIGLLVDHGAETSPELQKATTARLHGVDGCAVWLQRLAARLTERHP